MKLTFRAAEASDLAAVQQAYQRIIEHLAQTVDYPHWHTENHPTVPEVQAWVASGGLYLALEEDRVAGVVVLNHEAPQAYDTAAWGADLAPEEVLVVHALGVLPDYLGQGVARFLLDCTLDLARVRGCRAVRLDTYVENLPARRLYERYGFTDLGCHTLTYEGTDLNQFHLFEYLLSPGV